MLFLIRYKVLKVIDYYIDIKGCSEYISIVKCSDVICIFSIACIKYCLGFFLMYVSIYLIIVYMNL